MQGCIFWKFCAETLEETRQFIALMRNLKKNKTLQKIAKGPKQKIDLVNNSTQDDGLNLVEKKVLFMISKIQHKFRISYL